jgi:fatty-acid desaturase
LISGLGGVLVGHRYAAHRQFEFPSRWLEYFFYILYNLNTIGSAVNYANIHWLHHQHSDDYDKDPTNPKRNGILQTHFTLYKYDFAGKLNLRQFKNLMRRPSHKFFHKYYYLPHLVLALALLPFGFEFLLAFIAVPAVVAFHIAQVQVGILHLRLPGAYNVDETQHAFNIPWLKILLFGEELHSNHHKEPNNANRGIKKNWAEFDPLYHLLIRPFFKSHS